MTFDGLANCGTHETHMSCIERANQQCIRPLHFNVFHIVYWPPVNRFTLHAFIGYIVAQIATNCTMPFSHFSCVCMFCFVSFPQFSPWFWFFSPFFFIQKKIIRNICSLHIAVCFVSSLSLSAIIVVR